MNSGSESTLQDPKGKLDVTISVPKTSAKNLSQRAKQIRLQSLWLRTLGLFDVFFSNSCRRAATSPGQAAASPGSGLVFGVQSFKSIDAGLDGLFHCSGGRRRCAFQQVPASSTDASSGTIKLNEVGHPSAFLAFGQLHEVFTTERNSVDPLDAAVELPDSDYRLAINADVWETKGVCAASFFRRGFGSVI